jgi:hypothetical protein
VIPSFTSVRKETIVKKFVILSGMALGVVTLMTAMAVASGSRTVELEDSCDQATFNAAIGPGTCVGDGDVTFPEFLAKLNPQDFGHEEWRFHFGRAHIDKGETLKASNEGGEFHTFTEVKNYGGGCIPELNGPLGLTPVPECDPVIQVAPGVFVPAAFVLTGVNPGETRPVPGLTKAGTHHQFQCLIHPWMRIDVEVRK